MKVTFAFGATAGAKANGTQVGAVHGKIESANTSERRRARAVLEASEWSGYMRIQSMPAPAQSVFKKRKGRVAMGKARGQGNGELQFIPERQVRGGVHMAGRSHGRGNGLAMVLRLQAERKEA
jgi:hypothetical protein